MQFNSITDCFCENVTTRKNKQGRFFFPARNSVLTIVFSKPDPERKSQPVNDLMLIFPSQRNYSLSSGFSVERFRQVLLFLYDFYVTRPLFGLSTIAQKSQQSASRWRVLAFYRIAPCLKMSFSIVWSLVGISFHSFAPILENDFRSISSFDFLI